MTKTEVYRLVYRFFMESGVLQNFCNNVIGYGNGGHGILELRGKSAKDIIEFVINQYSLTTTSPMILYVWTSALSSFVWRRSNEGENFWMNCNLRWIRFIENNNIDKYERIEK